MPDHDAANNDAIAQLDELIERVRTLPKVIDAALPEVACEWKTMLQASIAAGLSPTGEPWKLTAEGKKPLAGAAADGKLGVANIGRNIYVRLMGVEARHHRGSARGRIKRQVILAGDELPPAYRDVVVRLLRKHFHQHLALTKGTAPNG
jgi:hypothetical protein